MTFPFLRRLAVAPPFPLAQYWILAASLSCGVLSCGRVELEGAPVDVFGAGSSQTTGGMGTGGGETGGTTSAGGSSGVGGEFCDSSGDCVPGDIECDAELGSVKTCVERSGCVAWELSSTQCVRELVMDQESNVACAIWGPNQLHCFSPGSVGDYTDVLPEKTKTLIIPDDSNLLLWGVLPNYCSLKTNGELECSRGGSVSTQQNCTAASLSDQLDGLLCTDCGGKFSCNRPVGDVPTTVESFVVGDGVLAYIQDGAIRQLGAVLTFSGLKDIFRSSVGDLCGIESNGDGIRCVIASDTYLASTSFKEASAGLGGWICGVDADNNGKCLQLQLDNPFVAPTFLLSRTRHLRASATTACALSLDGHVRCFSKAGDELSIPAELM